METMVLCMAQKSVYFILNSIMSVLKTRFYHMPLKMVYFSLQVWNSITGQSKSVL